MNCENMIMNCPLDGSVCRLSGSGANPVPNTIANNVTIYAQSAGWVWVSLYDTNFSNSNLFCPNKDLSASSAPICRIIQSDIDYGLSNTNIFANNSDNLKIQLTGGSNVLYNTSVYCPQGTDGKKNCSIEVTQSGGLYTDMFDNLNIYAKNGEDDLRLECNGFTNQIDECYSGDQDTLPTVYCNDAGLYDSECKWEFQDGSSNEWQCVGDTADSPCGPVGMYCILILCISTNATHKLYVQMFDYISSYKNRVFFICIYFVRCR